MPCIARQLISGNGFQRVRFSTPGTAPYSNLWATVTEGNYNQTYIGAARIYVCSVAPGWNETWVSLQIDWNQNLVVRVSLFNE
jgi:hypothetical protein